MKANRQERAARHAAYLEHEAAVRAFLTSLGLARPAGKRRRKARRFVISIEELDDEPIAPLKTPAVDILDAFADVLRHLSLRERQVLLLRIAGTLTREEIAKALAVTTDAVRSAFDRVCKKARSLVSANGL